MTNSLEALFCYVDDFWQIFEPKWQQLLLGNGLQQRQRSRCLGMSEIMTILISFHQNHYRNFKHFYEDHVCKYWRKEFPKLPSYNRFVEFMGTAMMPLCIYLKQCWGKCTGISFVDSTCLHVCHNLRIKQHRVFKGMAERGKTSVDWFFGFKLTWVRDKKIAINLAEQGFSWVVKGLFIRNKAHDCEF